MLDFDMKLTDMNNFIGTSVSGRAVTHTLRVSPNGNGADGLSWKTAFQNIEDALDAAPTANGTCTLILIAPHTSYYDINRTGDPTWTGSYILKGTHRTWAKVMNTHGTADSIMKFTGRISINDLIFNLGTGNTNGVIATFGPLRVKHCQFIGRNLTGAATAIDHIGAAQIKHSILDDIHMIGHVDFMTGLKMTKVSRALVKNVQIHECLKGIHIIDALSTSNSFNNVDIGDCHNGGSTGMAFDIDAGSEQHFNDILLHHNDTNFSDLVHDHIFNNLKGQFPITIEPIAGVNYAGVTIAAGEDTWGADVELRAALTSTKPFRIVGYRFEPSEEKKFMIRFSADSGVSWFDMSMIEVKKNKAQGSSSGTEFIFNAGTRISASAGCEDAGKSIQIWLEIQEI